MSQNIADSFVAQRDGSSAAGESPLDQLRARLDAMSARRDPPVAEVRAEVVAISAPLPEAFNAPPPVVQSDAERIRRLSARFRTIHY